MLRVAHKMRLAKTVLYTFSDAPKPQAKNKDLGNLLRLIKPEYKICLWGIGVMGVSSGVLLFIPQLFLQIGQLQEQKFKNIDDCQSVEARKDADAHNARVKHEYIMFGLKLTVFCLFSGTLGFLRRHTNQMISNRIAVRIRSALFQKFIQHRNAQSPQSAELVHRLANDVSLIANGLSVDILMGVRGLLMTVGGAGYLYLYAFALLKPAFVAMMFFTFSTRMIAKMQRHYKILETNSLSTASELAHERLQAYRLIKLCNMEQPEIQRYLAQLSRYYDHSKKHSQYQALNMGMVEGLGIASLIGLMAYGSFLISIGVADSGLLVQTTYGLFLAAGLRTMMNTYTELTKTSGIYSSLSLLFPNLHNDEIYCDKMLFHDYQGRIKRDDELTLKMLNPPLKSSEEDILIQYDQEQLAPPTVEFRDISFRHPGHKYILKQFNMKVESGQVVALIGRSGSGKTTIMNLMTKLLNPEEGDILIDGESLSSKDFKWIQRYVSYVPQDATIFSATVYENIVFGNQGFDQSLEHVMQAAKLANAHEFISDLPQGYFTKLKSDGTTSLSGGQKQRIILARAILKNPRILIFDEATSNIDGDSETQIIEALKGVCKHKTCFIVTHKIENYRSLITNEIDL